jgi:hypothetical protein
LQISAFHEAARAFASAGWPIFPCHAGSKKPATARGFHDATTAIEQIDAWWTENPDYNPACPINQAGKSVIDLDGPSGLAAWQQLVEQHGYQETYEVTTPRGGKHIYYEGTLPTSAWSPNTKRALGEHIDTRGAGSYVLIPPSVITEYTGADAEFNGRSYEVTAEHDIAVVPGWCSAILAARNERAVGTGVEADLPGAVDRARTRIRDKVNRGDVAVSGAGGNNTTYRIATELLELGLTPNTALSLLKDEFNPYCLPRWGDEELEAIVDNASRYAQNEQGAFAVAPAAEVFAAALDKLPVTPEQPGHRSRFYFENDEEQNEARDPVWLVPELIPDAATVLLVGSTGSFKTFIAQHIALGLAAQTETLGIKPLRYGPTFFGAHEGRNELKKNRKNAWKVVNSIERSIPFFVAPAPRVALEGECDDFREQIRVRLRQSTDRIALIVLDTVAKCMVGLNENDARDIGLFVQFCDSLRDEFECSVIALHHLGKDKDRGGRGSSALQAGFDTTLNVHRVPGTKLVELKVVQHKDAEERSQPFTFEGKSVGASLVFQPITSEAFAATKSADNPFTDKKVGAALRHLEAIGIEAGVTTHVLCAELLPPIENENFEEREKQLSQGTRKLNALARSSLAGYCDRTGNGLFWFLPSTAMQPSTAR